MQDDFNSLTEGNGKSSKKGKFDLGTNHSLQEPDRKVSGNLSSIHKTIHGSISGKSANERQEQQVELQNMQAREYTKAKTSIVNDNVTG